MARPGPAQLVIGLFLLGLGFWMMFLASTAWSLPPPSIALIGQPSFSAALIVIGLIVLYPQRTLRALGLSKEKPRQ